MMFRRLPDLAVLILVLVVGGAEADSHLEEPALLQADEVSHDDRNSVTTAEGSVEFATRGYVLKADRLVYSLNDDRVTATGNVIVVDPDGQTIFSDHVELTGDLREGIVEGIRMLFSNGARLAANRAKRTDGRFTIMERAVYSPCELCPDNPERPPVWQLKARHVTHDQETRDVTYRDVTLEFFGIPVAYSPFVRHPDPTVDRRSGFLVPDYGSSSTLGSYVRVPYYFNLAPERDATLAPILSRKEGLILFGEYRELMGSGGVTVEGSVTRARARHNSGQLKGGHEARWHVKAGGLWMDGPDVQIGADLHRSSDDGYLSRYGFSDQDTLTSDVFVEHFDDRSYTTASGYLYQGLRPSDDPSSIPLVAPLVNYNYTTPPSQIGSSVSLDTNLLVLTRGEGPDSRRFSAEAAWQAPFLTRSGQLYTAQVSLRGDAFHASDVELGANRKTSGFAGRIVPQGLLEWRYLLARSTDSSHQFIEPIVMVVWSPNGGNPEDIPNEDGQEFEFDEVNLFSTNRFPGLDRIEGGLRLNYGLRLGEYGFERGRNELFVGQSWRHRDDDTFDEGQGLEGHFSDYVGRLQVNPYPYLDMLYRFRISNELDELYRSEFGARIGPEETSFQLGYVRLDENSDPVIYPHETHEQITAATVLKLFDNWTLRGNWRSDLGGAGTISYNGSLTYEDECTEVTLRGERRFTDATDFDPQTVIMFKVRLLTLG